MRKIIIAIFLVTAFGLTAPKISMAQYGQYGQTLSSEVPEVVIIHEPTNAGIEDYLNPKFFSMLSFSLSGAMFALSKRKQNLLPPR